jgi:hypothetical protein
VTRYRSTEEVDQAELRERVSGWLDEHPDGTGDELIAALAAEYPGHRPDDVAVVLRAAMFAEQRERQR